MFKTTITLLVCLFFLAINANSQTTYDFSTGAILSGKIPTTWPWNTTANITIGGVDYILTSGGNGDFSNSPTGGVSNGKCLKKDGSGGDSFSLSRVDGKAFQFYGIWVTHQSMNSYTEFYTLPPWYTLSATGNSFTYQDMTAKTPGIAWNNYTYSSTAITSGTGGIAVTSVQINFSAIIYYAIDNIIVGPAITPLSATTSNVNASCNGGSNGSATVIPTGGSAPYNYAWSPSGGTAATATNLSAGSYSCTITDALSATIVKNFTITQPTKLVATAASQTNLSCNSGSNGTATVSATGGTPGYTYSWSPSGGTAATASGLTAGTYIVTVTDANSCSTTQSFTITQPTKLVATAVAQTNVSCNGGSNGTASVTASGGAGGYTYSWSPSGGTAATASGLTAGNYTVTVTDANSCSTTQSFTITQAAVINLTITLVGATLTATQTGATYQWYKCPNTLLLGETNQSYTPSQLGDYKVDITVGSCTTTSLCTTITTLGTTNFETTAKLSIYPNPSQGILKIESDSDGDYQLINQLGQILKTFKIKANITNIIDLQNLNNNVYFIKEMNNNKSHRIIIKK